MADDVLRLSQVIGTFGPGAMLDLPERSVLVGGLDRWDIGAKGASRVIEELRLSRLLERRLQTDGRVAAGKPLTLRTPPVHSGDKATWVPGIAVTVFPSWFVCDSPSPDDTRRRRLVTFGELDPKGRKRYRDESGKPLAVSPIRFVCGCARGHIQDVQWRWVVHGSTPCSEPIWLEEGSTSADPRDTVIVCGCGKSLSLQQLFQPGRLGKCVGERPWIGDKEGCDEKDGLKLLTRSATNTYFPQIATVISLPHAEDELTRRVAEFMTDLRDAKNPDEISLARRFNASLRAAFDGFTDEEVFARVEQLLSGLGGSDAADPRVAEFEVFASGRSLIGENRPNAHLHAETLPRAVWDPDGNCLLSGIASLVAVHRLREVACLYGFTRFEAAPTADEGLEDVGLAVRGAPLGTEPDWLPAIEQFGEGLFLHFDSAALKAWLERGGTQMRAGQLQAGHGNWKKQRNRQEDEWKGIAYVLAHSLSHALMGEIALDCGYPASALKERIYALDGIGPGAWPRCGILIYTATAGTQGTLGGLVEVAGRFPRVLHSALERLSLCSSDPVCADHDPTSRNDDRALHGAACHGCLLVAETSCEARNLYLDRATLVKTVASDDAAFFVYEP